MDRPIASPQHQDLSARKKATQSNLQVGNTDNEAANHMLINADLSDTLGLRRAKALSLAKGKETFGGKRHSSRNKARGAANVFVEVKSDKIDESSSDELSVKRDDIRRTYKNVKEYTKKVDIMRSTESRDLSTPERIYREFLRDANDNYKAGIPNGDHVKPVDL